MRYDPEQVTAAFNRLFSTYPQFGGSDLNEAMRAYFEAVEPYETPDITRAVKNFLTGSAPGVNPAFAPSAPMIGAECRRVMNLRLDSERRVHRPALPEPPRVSPERRREMGHVLDQLANRLRSRGDAA